MGKIFSRTIIRDPGGEMVVRTVSNFIPTDGSLLLVDAGTIGCFICNGKPPVLYPPGRHVLNTGLSPYFLQLRNWKTDGDPGVSACAFFVSTQQEYCTNFSSGDVSFREKDFRLTLKAECDVSLQYRVISPQRFLRHVVGLNHSSITMSEFNLRLQQLILPHLREQLGKRLSQRDITDMTAQLHNLSMKLTSDIAPELKPYGIQGRLVIQAIRIPNDQLQRVSALEQEREQTRLRISLEKQHIREVYQDLENRTRIELLTGVSRLPPLPGQASPPATGGSTASLMASMPVQLAMLQYLLAGLNLHPTSMLPSDPSTPFSWAGTLTAPSAPTVPPNALPTLPPFPGSSHGGD